MRFLKPTQTAFKFTLGVGAAGYGWSKAGQVEDDARRRQNATADMHPGSGDVMSHIEVQAARKMSVDTTHDAVVGLGKKLDVRRWDPTTSPREVWETARHLPDAARVIHHGTGHPPIDALIANRKVVASKQTAMGMGAGLVLGTMAHPVARLAGLAMTAATVFSALTEVRRVHSVVSKAKATGLSGMQSPSTKPPTRGGHV